MIIGTRQAKQDALGAGGRCFGGLGPRFFSEITPMARSGLAGHLMLPAKAKFRSRHRSGGATLAGAIPPAVFAAASVQAGASWRRARRPHAFGGKARIAGCEGHRRRLRNSRAGHDPLVVGRCIKHAARLCTGRGLWESAGHKFVLGLQVAPSAVGAALNSSCRRTCPRRSETRAPETLLPYHHIIS